ncbi:MAG: radical SAM protein [Planctomycetota bacterium]
MAKILFIHRLEFAENTSLSIEILSSYLKLMGHETNLILDFYDSNFICRLYKRIKTYGPDLIGFSVLTPIYSWAIKVSEIIKGEYDIPIVFGNVHASALPELTLKNKHVDFVIRGEGEKALSKLMTLIDTKPQNYSSVYNLCYKDADKIIYNPIENVISDLDSLPFPDKSITKNEVPFYDDIYYCQIERGCPYNCSFCFNHFMREFYNKKGSWLRKRSVENVIEELKMAKKQGYKFIYPYDDCFARDLNWLAKFVNLYKKYVNLPLEINSRFRYMSEETARLLLEAKCISVKMGVQTTSERLLRNVCNRFVDKNAKEAVKNLKKYNILVKVDTMYNLPTQSEHDILEDIEFYTKLRPDFITAYNLLYFPKTNIVNYGTRYGLITEKDIERIQHGGLRASYIKDKKLLSFMTIIAHLPVFIIRFILKYKLWNKIPNMIFKYKIFLQIPYYISTKSRFLLSVVHLRRRIRFKYYLLRFKMR